MTKQALGTNEFLYDNHSNHTEPHVFFNFKESFIHDRERLIYDKIWCILKIKRTCKSYIYHAIILLLKVRLMSTSISVIEPLFFFTILTFLPKSKHLTLQLPISPSLDSGHLLVR